MGRTHKGAHVILLIQDLNMEIVALTAAVLGAVSLSGGKGTALRALIGTAVVVVLANGLVIRGVDANVYNATTV